MNFEEELLMENNLVIKSDLMNAAWFLKYLNQFKTACAEFSKHIFFAARTQHLLVGGGVKNSIFFCDEELGIIGTEAREREYEIAPFVSFREETVHALWKIDDCHWEVEFYVFSRMTGVELIRLAFYSCGPAIVVREMNWQLPELTSRVFTNILALYSKEIITQSSSKEAMAKHCDEIVVGMQIPIKDERFACLRQ